LSLELSVVGQKLRVLHVNRDSGIALCVFQDQTFDIPIRSLFQIADRDSSLEDLTELLRLSVSGFGSDRDSSDRNSYAMNDSDISDFIWLPGAGLVLRGSFMAHYTPLSVGDLTKDPYSCSTDAMD